MNDSVKIVKVVEVDKKLVDADADSLKFAEDLLRGVRFNFEKDGYLIPFACLVCTRHPQSGETLDPYAAVFITASFEDENSKEEFAQVVRRISQVGQAKFVFTAAEAWAVKGEADIESWQGKVSEHPGRMEVLFATLDRPLTQSVHWTAAIQRDSNDEPTLLPFEKQDSSGAEGRFVNLAGSPPPKADA